MHRFDEALPLYEQLLEQGNDYNILFKIAVCNYHQSHYYYSMKILNSLKEDGMPYREYLDYFLFLITLKIEEKEQILANASRFLQQYDGHFLSDSLRLKVADYCYQSGDYREAYPYYEYLLRHAIRGNDRIHVMKQLALIKFYTDNKTDGMARMYQILKKYPGSDDAISIAKYMNYLQPDNDTFFFAVVDVFLYHRYFTAAKQKLEQYINLQKNEALLEKARYNLIRIYYLEGSYATALYGFKNILNGLKNENIEAKIRLEIARCQLNLNNKEEAIQSYREYAEKFSRRRLAAEAVWKAAWIYEELGNIPQALKLYQSIRQRWSRSQFAYEAKFREGFSYYRLQEYRKAQVIFKEIADSGWSDLHKYRAKYWLAKLYTVMGRDLEAREIQIELGTQLFESYYSAKCYRMHSAYIDSLLAIPQRIAMQNISFENRLTPGMYERPLAVKNLLGNSYALQELDRELIQPKSFSDWIELACVYENLGAYDDVHRIYSYINNRYFDTYNSIDKTQILKALYPVWYFNVVHSYCDQRALDENLIFAIIRQESIFDREAKSAADAYGLMQIIPPTASSLASQLSLPFTDEQILFQENYNINLGTLYVAQLLELFNGQIELMLAAYNAGPHRVQRWILLPFSEEIDQFIENIEFSQTRNYVRSVMRNYWAYQFLYQDR
jgi:soluble lytic murein transglycosylase-like protein/TolA-binding protein